MGYRSVKGCWHTPVSAQAFPKEKIPPSSFLSSACNAWSDAVHLTQEMSYFHPPQEFHCDWDDTTCWKTTPLSPWQHRQGFALAPRLGAWAAWEKSCRQPQPLWSTGPSSMWNSGCTNELMDPVPGVCRLSWGHTHPTEGGKWRCEPVKQDFVS